MRRYYPESLKYVYRSCVTFGAKGRKVGGLFCDFLDIFRNLKAGRLGTTKQGHLVAHLVKNLSSQTSLANPSMNLSPIELVLPLAKGSDRTARIGVNTYWLKPLALSY